MTWNQAQRLRRLIENEWTSYSLTNDEVSAAHVYAVIVTLLDSIVEILTEEP